MAKNSTAANNDVHLLLCDCLRPRSHKHKPTKKFVIIRGIRGPFFLNRLSLWLKSRYIHFPKTLFRGSKNLCNSFPPKKSVQICVICGKINRSAFYDEKQLKNVKLSSKFIGINIRCLSINYRKNSANNFTAYIV